MNLDGIELVENKSEIIESEREAMEAFYNLAENHIMEIMSARACLLAVKGLKEKESDVEQMREDIDKFIADKGAEYQRRYASMDVPDIITDTLMTKIVAKAKRKAESVLEEHNSDN